MADFSARARSFTRFLLIGLAALAYGAETKDLQLEQRVNAVAAELRCLVCQNQTIADSNADLAVDLKNQIREKMREGASEADIVAYMVARYGDFVLYRPPFKATTILLWAGPFIFLIAGFWFLLRFLRRRQVPAPQLSAAERSRAAKLLE